MSERERANEWNEPKSKEGTHRECLKEERN